MSEKGISLIALIVTIIVIIILAVATFEVGEQGFETTDKAKIANEIREVETAVVKRFSDYAISESAAPLLGEKLELEDAISLICTYTDFTDADVRAIITENIYYVRKVDSSNINELGIKNATGNLYVVDYYSGKVYGPVE